MISVHIYIISSPHHILTHGWVLLGPCRSNKRYFYQHEQSRETQWEYPAPDIVGGGEEMDICTTPPPEEPPVASPAPPPVEERPSPPPPPRITTPEPPPPPPPPIISREEPPPPGVDEPKPADSMAPELDSFYSDIAKISESNSKVEPPTSIVAKVEKAEEAEKVVKKKKKPKVNI